MNKTEEPADFASLTLDPATTAFFFDFDGTLAEIVDDPDAVTIGDDVRDALVAIGETAGGALAVISGREIAAIVLGLAEQLTTADEIVFADTIGVGVPRQVRALLGGARHLGTPLGLHLHNTRNTGYANAYTAMDEGVALLDASVGGIGGCPFAPRATGNIATEDLLYLLDHEGVDTGIDLDEVIRVAEWLETVLGRQLPGQLYRAGSFPPALS